MRLIVCSLVVAVAFGGDAGAADKDASLSVAEAIQLVSKPTPFFGNSSPSQLQVHARLMWLLHVAKYKYEKSHDASWKACILDEEQNMYARLCAAYFLMEQHDAARGFVRAQLASKNLRHRYNAAAVVNTYVGRDRTKKWGIAVLIKLLADGSIDGSGVQYVRSGEYPDGDRHDIMTTPIESICYDLGYMQEKTAVPALISALNRRAVGGGATFALGEIRDKRAIPVLMGILEERLGYGEVMALGKLECREAVPILISRLGDPADKRDPFNGSEPSEDKEILEALLAIGDKRAISPIHEFLKAGPPQESRAVARRVLAQMESPDPVDSLLALLEAETYEPERSDILFALAKYKDLRVVRKLETVARSSGSAFMRREAIFALKDIGDRRSLRILASLLDVTFPKDLKADWGWKGIPDFREYFPETIAMCLKQCTNQDFGTDRAKWEEWIIENVEPRDPVGRQ